MFEIISLGEVQGYEYNNRVHTDLQIKELKNSLEEDEYTNHIVLDEKNIIVAGHGRLQALLDLGYTEASVRRIDDMTEDELRALRLVDNEIARLGGYNDLFFPAIKKFADEEVKDFFDARMNDVDVETADFDMDDIEDRLSGEAGGDLQKMQISFTLEQYADFEKLAQELLEVYEVDNYSDLILKALKKRYA